MAPAQRRRTALADDRFHGPHLCQCLIDHALETAEHDPLEARRLAELALELVTRLSPSWSWEALLADLEARGWACLGHTCRLLGEVDEANEALHIAERRLADGTGDPLEEALVLWLRAQLAADRGDLDAAELGLDRVIAIATGSQHPQQLARAFLLKAEVWARRGDLRSACEIARTACNTAAIDARLLATGQRQWAGYLEAMGRSLEAQRLLQRAGRNQPQRPRS